MKWPPKRILGVHGVILLKALFKSNFKGIDQNISRMRHIGALSHSYESMCLLVPWSVDTSVGP